MPQPSSSLISCIHHNKASLEIHQDLLKIYEVKVEKVQKNA